MNSSHRDSFILSREDRTRRQSAYKGRGSFCFAKGEGANTGVALSDSISVTRKRKSRATSGAGHGSRRKGTSAFIRRERGTRGG